MMPKLNPDINQFFKSIFNEFCAGDNVGNVLVLPTGTPSTSWSRETSKLSVCWISEISSRPPGVRSSTDSPTGVAGGGAGGWARHSHHASSALASRLSHSQPRQRRACGARAAVSGVIPGLGACLASASSYQFNTKHQRTATRRVNTWTGQRARSAARHHAAHRLL